MLMKLLRVYFFCADCEVLVFSMPIFYNCLIILFNLKPDIIVKFAF